MHFSRELTPSDLGIRGTFIELRGTFSLLDDLAIIEITMIRAEIHNPFEVIRNLKALARAQGASNLRIQGTLANSHLESCLTRRYGLHTEGSVDFIQISLQ